MEIRAIDFDDPQVLDLLRLHLDGMHANSPPSAVFALDLSGLRSPDVTFVGAWQAASLAGFGALKQLSPTCGELKSMRTAPGHLRQGVALRVLTYLIDLARDRGYSDVVLETGSGPAFEPAISLYGRHGFVPTEAFGDYEATDFNQFMRLDLSRR